MVELAGTVDLRRRNMLRESRKRSLETLKSGQSFELLILERIEECGLGTRRCNGFELFNENES
jgi:hypothetical protein